MVTIVIDRKYLHYVTPDLDSACRIMGQKQYAYCKFLPDGMQCNVISWKCLDVRNLVLQDSTRDYLLTSYHDALGELRKYQKEEKRCLEEVRNEIARVEDFFSNLAKQLIFGSSAQPLISDESAREEEEYRNRSNKKSELSTTSPKDLLYGSAKVQVFIAIFLGEEVCYNDEIEIYLLPPVNLLGYVGQPEDSSWF